MPEITGAEKGFTIKELEEINRCSKNNAFLKGQLQEELNYHVHQLIEEAIVSDESRYYKTMVRKIDRNTVPGPGIIGKAPQVNEVSSTKSLSLESKSMMSTSVTKDKDNCYTNSERSKIEGLVWSKVITQIDRVRFRPGRNIIILDSDIETHDWKHICSRSDVFIIPNSSTTLPDIIFKYNEEIFLNIVVDSIQVVEQNTFLDALKKNMHQNFH